MFSPKSVFSWTTMQLEVCCVVENVYIYKLLTLKSCRHLKMTC